MATLAVGAVLIWAAPASAQEDDGAAVYQQSCASCHQADGSGVPGAFPPLSGNPNATDLAYVVDVVRNGVSGPIDVNGETFDAVMPAVAGLSEAQIQAVSEYVVGLAGAAATPVQPVEPAGVIGDAGRGEALFLGGSRLANGGPACLACHAAGTHTQGGAGLGPDLTAASARLGGEAGLLAWLASPPTETMSPLFADHPMSEPERADIAAYLASLEGDNATGTDWFPIAGLAGTVLLVGLVAAFTTRSRRPYNDRLRSAR